MLTKQSLAIRAALLEGYTVDAINGDIIGKKGARLKLRVVKGGRLEVSISTSLFKDSVWVSVHKMVAYWVFGDCALDPDNEVHHIDEKVTNNRASNLEVISAIAHRRHRHTSSPRPQRSPDQAVKYDGKRDRWVFQLYRSFKTERDAQEAYHAVSKALASYTPLDKD